MSIISDNLFSNDCIRKDKKSAIMQSLKGKKMSSHIKIGISTVIQEKCKAKMSKETNHNYEQLHELKAI
jgi:hypothetical protein